MTNGRFSNPPAANISTTAVLRCTCSHFILNFEFFILHCAVQLNTTLATALHGPGSPVVFTHRAR